MFAAEVVEAIYVFEEGDLNLAPGLPVQSPGQFRLERLEEAFDGGIAVTVVLQTFGVNDFETAKWLSQMIGWETTGYRTESYKPGEVPPTSFNVTARDLMTPDEIMQIPPNTQLLRVHGNPTMVVLKLRYFADKEFDDLYPAQPQ